MFQRRLFELSVRRVGVGALPSGLVASRSSIPPWRRLQRPPPTWIGRAWETTETGDDKTGHVVAGPDESLLFIDNLFPLNLSNILWRPLQTDQDVSAMLKRFTSPTLGVTDPIALVKRAIPADMPITVNQILPRLKEGGAFVKFQHPDEVPVTDIESKRRAGAMSPS